MVIRLLYFSLIFILGLLSISNSGYFVRKGRKEKVSKSYMMFCISFACWCFLSLCASFSDMDFWTHVFYYLTEFAKVVTFVTCFEIISDLTNFKEENTYTVHRISSAYLYIGIAIIFLNLLLTKANIDKGDFGVHFVLDNYYIAMLTALYYVVVLFGMSFLVLNYREQCKKQREDFAFNLFIFAVVLAFAGMVIEIVGFVAIQKFIPSVILIYAFMVIHFKFCIHYKNSIIHSINDYEEELSSTNTKSVVVVDESKNVLYKNKRLEIMIENFRDKFDDRNLYAIFEISKEDRSIIDKYKGDDPLDINAVYIKKDVPVVLTFKNRYDRFGRVFSSVVTIVDSDEYLSANGELPGSAKVEEIPENQVEESVQEFEFTSEHIKLMQMEELIHMMEFAAKFYNESKKEIFEYNLKGIIKSASNLGFAAIEELAGRMSDACLFKDWESIEPMLIEMDRQSETVKSIARTDEKSLT